MSLKEKLLKPIGLKRTVISTILIGSISMYTTCTISSYFLTQWALDKGNSIYHIEKEFSNEGPYIDNISKLGRNLAYITHND
jgi:hypothetical protein